MRTTSCTVQQAALTDETLSVVNQAIAVARRRGHVQVTPLHVANTMLTAATGLLRTACQQSLALPLQCKALELCFNVALNRLPASSSGHMLCGSSSLHHPSVSNALVAAFKRAQAHQRRGSIENQQQPILSVKIELEQLVISILDDPSVSRVMKEAGFSSTQVKTNVEKAVSSETSSQSTPSSKSNEVTPLAVLPGTSSMISQIEEKTTDPVKDEDVKVVIENLINKKSRRLVFVGDPVSSVENAIQEAIERVERKDVPEVLKGVKFIDLSLSIKLSLSSIERLSRAEVEQKLDELTNLVRNCLEKGVVLYLGDLKWASVDRRKMEQGRGFYSPLEHTMMELGKLVHGVGENERFWLVGIATFQTYMKYKTGYSSPDTIWALNPVTIPAGSLRLSLSSVSDPEIHSLTEKAQIENEEEDNQFTSCEELSANFAIKDGRRSLQSTISNSASTTSSLPAWLQPYKSERKRLKTYQNCAPVSDICRNNSISNSTDCDYPTYEKSSAFDSSTLTSSAISCFAHARQSFNGLPLVEAKESCHRHCWTSEAEGELIEPNSRMDLRGHLKQLFPSRNLDSIPSPASSSDKMETEYTHKFKEFNSENLVTLSNSLEKKVPWQKDVIPEIARTIMQCRSGRIRRKGKTKNGDQIKKETWLSFQGVDSEGKEKIAKEIARLVFGSHSENFISIASSSLSNTKADSTDKNYRNKRSREDQSGIYIEKFAEAVLLNPHRVFLVEDVEQADYWSQIGFKTAIERGKITISDGEQVSLDDAIVILSCETLSSISRASSPPNRQKREETTAMEETRTSPCLNLDLNISINDDDDESSEDCDSSIDDVGLLESVDGKFLFKIKKV